MDKDLREILGLFIPVAVIVIIILGLTYYGSCVQAKVFNTQNQTNYSCSDFFWAGNQINTQTQTIKLR